MNEQLPDGWVESTLGEIADWSSGGTPDTKNGDYYDGDITWVVTGDLTDGLVKTSQKTITKSGLDNSSAKIVPLGSVLIAMYGASIGRLGITDVECATNQAIAYTKQIYGGIQNWFLFYYLQAKKEAIVALGVGGAQPNISQTILKEITIPLPPLAEQARIVAVLDDLMARVRSAQTQLATVPKLLKRFRQSVLSAAVSGKLTEDWREENPDVESAEKMVNEMLISRESNYLQNVKTAKTNSTKTPRRPNLRKYEPKNEELYEIPSTWYWTNFDVASEKIFDGTHFSPKNYPEGEYMYITAKNIKQWGLDLSNITYVNSDVHQDIYSRADVKYNDVLYIKDGATAGIALVNPLKEEFSLLSSVGVFRLDEQYVLPMYVSYFLNGNKELMLANVAGAAITRLTLEKLKIAAFALPPVSEQREIVRRVKSLMDWAEKLEAGYKAAKRQQDAMPSAILAKAFAGELTEQNPADESADRLLERIRTEREEHSSRYKSARKTVKKSVKKQNMKELALSIFENFGHESFTFDELKNHTSLPYQELKDNLFQLIEKSLVEDSTEFLSMDFDEEVGLIKYTLTSNANKSTQHI